MISLSNFTTLCGPLVKRFAHPWTKVASVPVCPETHGSLTCCILHFSFPVQHFITRVSVPDILLLSYRLAVKLNLLLGEIKNKEGDGEIQRMIFNQPGFCACKCGLCPPSDADARSVCSPLKSPPLPAVTRAGPVQPLLLQPLF